MHSVSGKVIVLTGAGSGMGLEAAKYLSSQSAKISISDVQEKALNDATSEIKNAGGTVISQVVDVSNRSQVEDWIQKTVETFGKIDCCVNMAGVVGRQHGIANIEEIDDDQWDFIQAVNVKGILNCMRAAIPHMNEGGSIVNAASVSGLQAFPKTAAYVASKFAVVGITKTAAKELGDRKIRCNCICPGLIDTPMLTSVAHQKGSESSDDMKSVVPLGRLGTTREVAQLIEWLLSDGSVYISGTAQRIDGGWVDY